MLTYKDLVNSVQQEIDARAELKAYRIGFRVKRKRHEKVVWLTEEQRRNFPLGRIFVESIGPKED